MNPIPTPTEEDAGLDNMNEVLTLKIEHVQALMNERMSASKLALDLYAAENHRRLEILNGEAERLRTMQATYIPREVYATEVKALVEKLSALEAMMAEQKGRGQVISGLISFVTAVVVAAFTGLGAKLLGH